jgi:hypothetical protein
MEDNVDWNQQVKIAQKRVASLRVYKNELVKQILEMERKLERLLQQVDETERVYLLLEEQLQRSYQKLRIHNAQQ